MKHQGVIFPSAILLVAILFSMCRKGPAPHSNEIVVFKTSMGEIVIELDREKAPISVQNFVAYVQDGFYDQTQFHRVIKGFVIQGGGYDRTGVQKPTRTPIQNEAYNGLKNTRGTIAYARTPEIHSATSQFFINVKDNPSLDFRDSTQAGYGYAVFGRVIKGMDVVDKIASVPTGTKNLSVLFNGRLYDQPRQDVPIKPVIIESAKYFPPSR